MVAKLCCHVTDDVNIDVANKPGELKITVKLMFISYLMSTCSLQKAMEIVMKVQRVK